MTLEELRQEYPELFKEAEEAIRKSITNEGEVESMKKEIEARDAAIEKMKKEIEAKDKASKISETETTLEAVLKESSLPEKLKERTRERSKGAVLSEEEIKASIQELEEIGQIFLEGVKAAPLPGGGPTENDPVKESRDVVAGLITSMWSPKVREETKTEKKE